MHTKGFTLVELMIVLAIIGILASIALPAYQNYLKRANVFEGVSLASSVKFAVYEYRHHKGTWPSNNSAADVPLATSINGNATRSVTINNGSITITYNTKVGNGQAIVFSPTINNIGSVEWSCITGSTVPAKYRPQNCRP